MNTPAMLLLLVLAPVLLPEFRGPTGGRFDLVSSALSLAAVLPVIYGIKRSATGGFGAGPAACIVAGLVLGLLFVSRQHRVAQPMIDLTMFRSRGFSGSLLANTVAMFALVGNAVFLTQYLQLALGMSPLRSALWSLVPSVVVAAAAPAATALAQRYDRGGVMAGGFLVGAAGFGVLTQVHRTSPLAVVIVGAGALAVGTVAVLTLVTDLVVGTVAPERAGSAAALMETGSEFGGSLGIAVLGSIGAAVYGSGLTLPAGLPGGAAHAARAGLAGATDAAAQLPAPVGHAVLTQARDAFSAGFDAVALTGSLLLAAAAALTLALLRGVQLHSPEPVRRAGTLG
jgi:MFS transporter, DHA2 family, multidrug resistance protein